ncbi:hypothetical protein P280DRAFT_519598 [Massarina eburnea CBS 473.64]|uniref:Uncharacterized protein n=1 Tax=Massarina eburnea CBS 473.64 TaxID=1395130 RepID=A0A6A6RYB1_9PLEO|nr:hypothetical protein P280DRAFT_519598 [Massarina eburnea CBS 473.64]
MSKEPDPFIDKFTFHYYIPCISNDYVDFYTTDEWVAYTQCEPDEEETEAFLLEDIELPLISEEAFQYYPDSTTSVGEEPWKEEFGDGEEEWVLGREATRVKLVKKKKNHEFWLERQGLKLLRMLNLK